jgi:putative phage-type endonuclease
MRERGGARAKKIGEGARGRRRFRNVESGSGQVLLKPAVEHIKSLPVIEQRSDEWYRIRDQMITASDFGQALGVGNFGSVKDFYIKKCGYQEPPPFYMGCLGHGIRYEPVATRAYELDMATTVHEFGLLQHPELQFLGASPDGITDHGIMIEIKCPFKRKIDGAIVDQYYYQMQGQLDVCNLDVCHFLDFAQKTFIFSEKKNENLVLYGQTV